MPFNESLSWHYYNPVEIITGLGIRASLEAFIPGGNTLIVTSKFLTATGKIEMLIETLKNNRITVYDRVTPNPELDTIDLACNNFRGNDFSCVIAIGGGSVIDTAKAFSVMLSDLRGLSLDSILRGGMDPTCDKKIFLAAFPTTSGTGSEVTPFATVWDSVAAKKYSLSGKHIYPSVALLDPSLTFNLPVELTLNTALDAISHALESLWNKNRNPVSIGFALQSLSLSVEALPMLICKLANHKARAKMQWASSLAGISISQTKTAIAHSISYPLTIHLGVPHGLAAGFTLIPLIDIYLEREASSYEKSLLQGIRELLVSMNNTNRIKLYGSVEKIKSLIPDMYDPSRADNYLFSTDGIFIEHIIDRSFDLL